MKRAAVAMRRWAECPGCGWDVVVGEPHPVEECSANVAQNRVTPLPGQLDLPINSTRGAVGEVIVVGEPGRGESA